MTFKVLIYGGHGWIGGQIVSLLKNNNITTIVSNTRVNYYDEILEELQTIQPTHIICTIGKTSGYIGNELVSTTDYFEYEGKLTENVHNNIYGPILIARAADRLNIHLTYLGTGCIFQYLEDTTYKFTEEDYPNFFGSSYSVTKGYTDSFMKGFDNVLNIRIKMPISTSLNPREFITKITNYKKICSIPNSMTVLDDLLPIMLDMTLKNITGTVNLVNPGVISHNEILQIYKELIDSDYSWENINYNEQISFLKSHRCNNILDTQKLENMYAYIPDIKTSVRNIISKGIGVYPKKNVV